MDTAGRGHFFQAPPYKWSRSAGVNGLTADAAAATGGLPAVATDAATAGTKFWWSRKLGGDPTDPSDFSVGDTFDSGGFARSTPAGQWGGAGLPLKAPRQLWVATGGFTWLPVPLDVAAGSYIAPGQGAGLVYSPSASAILAILAPPMAALGVEVVVSGFERSSALGNQVDPSYGGLGKPYQYDPRWASSCCSVLPHPPAALAGSDAATGWAPADWWQGGECLVVATTNTVPGGAPVGRRNLFADSWVEAGPFLASCEAAGWAVRPFVPTQAQYEADGRPWFWAYDLQFPAAALAAWPAQLARWGRFECHWCYHSQGPLFSWEADFPKAELEAAVTGAGFSKHAAQNFLSDADLAAFVLGVAATFFS